MTESTPHYEGVPDDLAPYVDEQMFSDLGEDQPAASWIEMGVAALLGAALAVLIVVVFVEIARP